MSRYLLYALILALVVSSCGLNRKISELQIGCVPAPEFYDDTYQHHNDLLNDSLLTSRYTVQSLAYANAYGLLPALRERELLRSGVSKYLDGESITLQGLLKVKEIEKVLFYAELEYENLDNALDCAILEMRQASNDLASSNGKTRSTYTNAAIAVGVVTSIMTVAVLVDQNNELNNSGYFDWLGVGGGIASAFLAIQSERTNKRVRLEHEVNLIRTIWEGRNDPLTITPTFWYLVNDPNLYPEGVNWRQQIIDTWISTPTMLGNDENMAKLEGLLANGNLYDEDLLKLRLSMLGTVLYSLQEMVKSLHRLKLEVQ